MSSTRGSLTPIVASFGALACLCLTLAAITLASLALPHEHVEYGRGYDLDGEFVVHPSVSTVSWRFVMGEDGVAVCRCFEEVSEGEQVIFFGSELPYHQCSALIMRPDGVATWRVVRDPRED